MYPNRQNCPVRHENGNCLSVGGFCTAVPDPICEAVRNAYNSGYQNGVKAVKASVQRGRWVIDEADSGEWEAYPGYIEFHCPICNEEYTLENGQYGWTYGDDIPFKFCHECGTKMDRQEG